MTVDAAQLKIALEEKEHWRRTLSVTVPAQVVAQQRQEIADRLAKRLKLPGFRKGKIPASVVEKKFGGALDQELLDKVIGEAYREALRMEDLQPISEGEVDDVKYEPREDLTFTISFDVRPQIELGRLGGFAVQRPEPVVKDEDLTQVLERLRQQGGTWVPTDEGQPVEGDMASVSVQKLVDGEEEGEGHDYDLVLGRGEAIPDVEDAIRSLEPGASGDFTVTFPEDFPTEERRGEKQHLRITLRARKVRELPELDDDFARSLGDFEDLDTLRAKIREDLEKEAEEQSESAVRSQLLQSLLEANPMDVPGSMVDRYIEGMLGDTKDADPEAVARAKEQIRPEAEQAVKRILLIERVAEIQDLRATEEDVDERIEAIAGQNDVSPSEVYASFQKTGRLETLEREITENNVFDFLKGQSEIVTAKA